MKKRWKAILGVMGVFLFGVIAGAILTAGAYEQGIRFFLHGDKKSGDVIVQRLSNELHLDAAQREQVRTIVTDSQAQMRPLREEMQPKIEAIIADSESKVRATLNPNQQKKFDKLVAEQHARWVGGKP